MIKLSKEKVLLLHQLMTEETGGSVGVRDVGLLESALNIIQYLYAHVIIGTSAENPVISRVSELALFSFFEKLGALLFIYKSK